MKSVLSDRRKSQGEKSLRDEIRLAAGEWTDFFHQSICFDFICKADFILA